MDYLGFLHLFSFCSSVCLSMTLWHVTGTSGVCVVTVVDSVQYLWLLISLDVNDTGISSPWWGGVIERNKYNSILQTCASSGPLVFLPNKFNMSILVRQDLSLYVLHGQLPPQDL